MPLLDHFRTPLYPRFPSESFHSFWAAALGEYLNGVLPPRYFATIHTHLGSRVEADVLQFEDQSSPTGNGKGDVAVQTWAPPAPPLMMPMVFPDDLEVQVHDERDDARLVAVVEIVSPGNKDRPESRRAFAAKCAAYLQRGIGLTTIDIVTSHAANLHNELVQLLQVEDTLRMANEATIYTVAYQPRHHPQGNRLAAWPRPLTLGEPLPIVPLALLGAGVIPLDLERTYSDARKRSRL